MKTHVVLHLVMDWEFGKSELTNLLEECAIVSSDGMGIEEIEKIECLLITQEQGEETLNQERIEREEGNKLPLVETPNLERIRKLLLETKENKF